MYTVTSLRKMLSASDKKLFETLKQLEVSERQVRDLTRALAQSQKARREIEAELKSYRSERV